MGVNEEEYISMNYSDVKKQLNYINKQKQKQMEQLLTSVSGSNLLDINGEQPKEQANEVTVNPAAYYFVDWNKLQNIQDLILILASVGFNFSPSHPAFQDIKHLLELDKPALPPNEQ